MLVARLTCGGCGKRFDANPHRVPMFGTETAGRWPCCAACWDRLNALRRQANMPEWDRPEDAYPPA